MLFFELLQIALENREELSRVPSDKEWEELYDESNRQAVTGILLHGIDRLPAEQRPYQNLLLQWIGDGQLIEQQNLMLDKRCVKLIKKLEDFGLTGSILKGQAIAQLYDKELVALRQSGDIDVYVDCGLKRTMEFAKSTGQKEIEWDYKHLHLNVWDDTDVEMHYRVEVLLNLWKNRRLQKWLHKHQDAIFNNSANLNTNGLVTPTVEFNVFYILLHIYRHFLYEGIGFRQIIDYYFVLKNVDANLNESYAYKAVSEFRMEKFAEGLMWMMKGNCSVNPVIAV